MDSRTDHQIDAETRDEALPRGEAELRAMLEQSRRDLLEGRIVDAVPVLDRMRATAARIRSEQAGDIGSEHRSA